MLISDVIKVLGKAPLKQFPWGCWVKDTVNLFVDEAARLTDESTGEDVLKSLETLAEDVRELVLSAHLDPAHHCVISPVGGGMVVKHDEPPLATEAELAALTKAMQSPPVLIAATVVSLVVFSALWMVSTLSVHDDVDVWGAVIMFLKVFGLAFA